MTTRVESVPELCETLLAGRGWVPRAGATKTALSSPSRNETALDVSSLTGVVDYLPSEYTVTVRPATPVAALARELAGHGQALPFDPVLVGGGATVGGTVAAGLAGPGRLRYGGVRDFVLGVEMVDGCGRVIRGGGKVVKNAAGFDLPKLLVGSVGALGVLTELTLKVFPKSEAEVTICAETREVAAAISLMRDLGRLPLDLDALDIDESGRLWAHIAGRAASVDRRSRRLLRHLGRGDRLAPETAAEHWRRIGDFDWLEPGDRLIKVPTTPARAGALVASLPRDARPYLTCAGQVLWLAWPSERPLTELDELLARQNTVGLSVIGSADRILLGERRGREVLRRLRTTFDPEGRLRRLG